MKIGFIQPWDSCRPPNVGGSLGIWTWEVARRLAQSHKVLVCTQRFSGVPIFEFSDGVQFYRFSTSLDARLLRIRRRVWQNTTIPDFASSCYCFIYLLGAATVMRAYGCNIIHIFNLSQFAPVIATINPGAKIVLNMHCDWLVGLDYSLVKKRLQHVDSILSCANCITDQTRWRFPHFAERCETLHNGVDVSEFGPREAKPHPTCAQTIITVGRISPEKGLHVLLEAFEKVLAKKPATRLRIIGPESILPFEAITKLRANSQLREAFSVYKRDYLKALRQRVSDSMESSVSFVDALPHGVIAAEMQRATVLVQPSLYDLFPLPVLEGMISGLPVVASNVGGLPEMVLDGETGLLIEPGDAPQLAEALLALLDNPKKAHAMGLAGRARALDMFSWEAIVRKLGYTYEFIQKS